MSDMRQHPDIFTDDEAAAYLHLDGPQSLESIRKNYGLSGYRPAGKGHLYWREDLDTAAMKMFGRSAGLQTGLQLGNSTPSQADADGNRT